MFSTANRRVKVHLQFLQITGSNTMIFVVFGRMTYTAFTLCFKLRSLKQA